MPLCPRLTIGIPTLGARPDRLTKAIASALGQSTPARVLVADQSRDGRVAELVEPFLAHPLFRRFESPATCLWENWTFAAECCDTEFFAWLQDDDVLAPHMARRVGMAFDRHPNCHTWLARLGISLYDGLSNWWQATGPMVPMDLITGGTIEVGPELVVGAGFFTSFALSPGVAFRWSLPAIEAVRRCPKDADLFVERVVLAELARLGPAVCDPAIVGMWNLHDGNESRRLVQKGAVAEQYRTMARHLDGLVAGVPGWKDALRGWSLMVGRDALDRWVREAEPYAGCAPALDEALALARELAPKPEPEPAPKPAPKKRAARA